MPRFVVLTHDHPFLHWDLMLEQGEVLRTWRLLAEPDSPGTIEAEAIGDHRLAYLDYEGPVSGGRGGVQQWDRGSYSEGEFRPDRLQFRLRGQRLHGEARLERRNGDRWAFHLTPD